MADDGRLVHLLTLSNFQYELSLHHSRINLACIFMSVRNTYTANCCILYIHGDGGMGVMGRIWTMDDYGMYSSTPGMTWLVGWIHGWLDAGYCTMYCDLMLFNWD